MKAAIYSRAEITARPNHLGELFEVLDKHGITYALNAPSAEALAASGGPNLPVEQRYDESGMGLPADADLMICYGGDGTFLDSVRLLDHRALPILGINAGRLGFLTHVAEEEIGAAVAEVAAGHYTVEERAILTVVCGFPYPVPFPHAINEFSIQKKGPTMVSVDLFVDGAQVATYVGDGLILSTPTGSTAYSLSVGGPIVAPDARCFVISPIASHNLTIRPLVVPDTARIGLGVHTRAGGEAWATLDNRNFAVEDGTVFEVEKSAKPVFLIKRNTISFYDTLRHKMTWGVERRK